MKRTNWFTKTLAIIGTVLVWVPVAAPIVFTGWTSIGRPQFNFDWLMPAEMAPLALAGGGLLLVAALLAHTRRGLVGWALGVAVGSLGLGALLTTATGLANGETELQGWYWAVLLGPIVLYVAAVIGLGVAGILLVKDLFSHRTTANPTLASGT